MALVFIYLGYKFGEWTKIKTRLSNTRVTNGGMVQIILPERKVCPLNPIAATQNILCGDRILFV